MFLICTKLTFALRIILADAIVIFKVDVGYCSSRVFVPSKCCASKVPSDVFCFTSNLSVCDSDVGYRTVPIVMYPFVSELDISQLLLVQDAFLRIIILHFYMVKKRNKIKDNNGSLCNNTVQNLHLMCDDKDPDYFGCFSNSS